MPSRALPAVHPDAAAAAALRARRAVHPGRVLRARRARRGSGQVGVRLRSHPAPAGSSGGASHEDQLGVDTATARRCCSSRGSATAAGAGSRSCRASPRGTGRVLRQPRHRRVRQAGRAVHGGADGRRRAAGARRGGDRARARPRREPRRHDRAGARASPRRSASTSSCSCCTTPGGPAAVPMPEVTMRLFAEAASLAPEVALRRFVENALGEDPPAELVDELFARRVANPPDPAGWQAQAAAGIDVPGRRRRDRRADADPRRHRRQRRRPPQRGAARRPASRARGSSSSQGAGHLFFWEQPDESVRIINEFLG